jgi:ribonucleotide reductase alpha subunit
MDNHNIDNHNMDNHNMDNHNMYVTKRNGSMETVSFDKILNRVKNLGTYNNIELNINYTSLAIKIIDQLFDGIKTSELDELTAQQCASMTTIHPDYGILASRILISNHHKNTEKSFSKVMKKLYNFKDVHDESHPKISQELYDLVDKYGKKIDKMIDYSRDYEFDYFGFKTLERSYLMKYDNIIVERPQHMWMRVSLGIHGKNLDKAKESYDFMSQKFFTHATPTLFNSGTPRPQLSSCYLIAMEDDSVKGIYNTMTECALISKYAGGIGLHIHNIRGEGTHIRGTNGHSNGIVPMLRAFNSTARYIDQGGGKRAGSFAMYIEPWHSDIEQFLQMKKNHGDEELRARDLFYALWIPDLFMERVKDNKEWTLMCPDKCKKLQDVYGDEFKELYEKYEKEGKGNKTVKARKIWFDILDSQIETGTPYMLFKDTANKKSNQKNLGTIKSSNLCVAPETTILTAFGYVEIDSLENLNVDVWNGTEWSNVTIRKTGINKHLIKICFSNNTILECTPNHIFYIDGGNNIDGDNNIDGGNNIIKLSAFELKKGMKIINFRLPSCNDNGYNEDDLIHHNDIYITDVIDENRYDDTYCFTEPKENKGIFNGILTGQCSEIIEYSNKDETAVCNLASIGLPKFVKNPDISFIENVKIYSKTDCVYCKLSKIMLNKYNINYEEVVLDETKERHEFYDKVSKEENLSVNINSVPQIYINNKRIGGYVELDKLLKPVFDYSKLHKITKVITENLNKVIDINFYPTEKTNRSNKLHRPIGIGIQGLADVYALMNLEFDSDEAKEINKKIFETIYHGALERSNEIAIERKEIINSLLENKDKWEYKNIVEIREKYNLKKQHVDSNDVKMERAYRDVCCEYISKNKKILQTLEELKLLEIEELKLEKEHIGSYSSFEGSPASQGILQYDMWDVEQTNNYNWGVLKNSIIEHGLRNSLFLAPMPTASTSQILGNNECFEPFTSNIYNRRTLAGEFVIINKHLLRELIDLDLWNVDLKNLIIANKGSIQNIDVIPKVIRNKYKIVWEIPMKSLIDMSRDRGAYVCQSQSLNLWMENPSYEKLTSMHFYSWKQGLKTGIYYLRTKASASAQQFTIDPKLLNKLKKNNVEDDEGCLMCSG